MSAQHTPGPWEARNLYVRTQSGQVVARCHGTLGKFEFEEPNARLIAAAPTIASEADAFTMLVERFMRADLPDGIQPATEAEVAEAMYSLRALIAKATGGAS